MKLKSGELIKLVIGISLALACTILIFWYSQEQNRQRELKQVEYYIQELSRTTAEHVKDVFADHLAAIKVSATLYGTSLESAEVNLAILNMLEERTSFDWIRFIALDGTDYASDGAIANCYDRDYFKKGISGQSGITEVLQSRINGQKLIGFYSPVYYNNEICGIMVGFLAEKKVSDILRTDIFNYPADTYLVGRDGAVIGQYLYDDIPAVVDLVDVSAKVKLSYREGMMEAIGNQDNFKFDFRDNGSESVGYAIPVDGTEWSVIQMFPQEVSRQIIRNSVTDSGIILAMIIAVFIILIVFFLYWLSRVYKSYTTFEVNKVREKGETEIQLIVAAARTVYPFIMQQNLTDNSCRIMYNDTSNSGSENVVSVDEMMENVLYTIPNDDQKAQFRSMFSREALLAAYERGECRLAMNLQQTYGDILCWMESTTILIEIDGIIYAISMARNIDDEIKITDELRLARDGAEAANRAKSNFLANMSHEIRTPINAILGMDKMIIRESGQKEIVKYARDVETAGNTLLTLINDILDFSKIESGKMEIIPVDYDLSSLINDLVNMIRPKAETKGLELRLKINPELPSMLYGDSVRIKQIILNILNNAVKYTEHGHISLIVDFEKIINDEADVLSQDEEKINLKVRVSDSGIGIKSKDLDRLFSPYQRLEEEKNNNIEGTGLGLSITKNLLESMGSVLEVQSVYREGSDFYFKLLQIVKSNEVIGDFESRMAGVNMDSDVDIEAFHAPDAHLLVVDDVEMNIVVVRNFLKRLKVNLDSCLSGMDAVEKSRNKKYDIIFLDSMMPEMNGSETLKVIREECDINRDTPIVVLTANAITGAREQYLNEGFDDYLSKPIDSNKLEQIIAKYLPDEKMHPVNEEDEKQQITDDYLNAMDSNNENEIQGDYDDPIIAQLDAIDGVTVANGIEASGGEDIYVDVCRIFYDTAAEKIEEIDGYYQELDIENYTIQVHALKSSARLLGADELSKMALDLEMAGKNKDISSIVSDTGRLLDEYRRYYEALKEIFEEKKETEEVPEKMTLSISMLKDVLSEMRETIALSDIRSAEDILTYLDDYELPEVFREMHKDIKEKMHAKNLEAVQKILDTFLHKD